MVDEASHPFVIEKGYSMELRSPRRRCVATVKGTVLCNEPVTVDFIGGGCPTQGAAARSVPTGAWVASRTPDPMPEC